MDLIKDAKKTCPKCSSPDMKDAKIVTEDNIEIPAKICTDCGFNGDVKEWMK